MAPNDPFTYAGFTEASSPSEQVNIGGSVSGRVLQNNGSDDLTITENGDFTFATPLTAGISYKVTVATQPADPAQTCTVKNNSGQVPEVPVTDVAVSCAEALVGNLSLVAVERAL